MHNVDDDKKDVGDNFCLSTPQTLIPWQYFFPPSRDEKVYLVESGTWVETINLKLADCANNNLFSFFFATSDIHGIRVGQSICWVKRTANVGEIRQSKQVIEEETGSGDLVVILLGTFSHLECVGGVDEIVILKPKNPPWMVHSNRTPN